MIYDNEVFVRFARLLSYPDIDMQADVTFLQEALARQSGDIGKLTGFVEFVQVAKYSDVEELFTSTFDMNAACCLEVGWHLYGEDYRRGEFLVQMRQSLTEENLPESGELPDHISNCLNLLTYLEPEDAHEFAKSYLLPALEKITAGFKKQETNPYFGVIAGLQAILKENYNIVAPHPALKMLNNQQDFLAGRVVNGLSENFTD